MQEATQICLAALTSGVTPIVRVCADALDEGTRALDNGALGIVVLVFFFMRLTKCRTCLTFASSPHHWRRRLAPGVVLSMLVIEVCVSRAQTLSITYVPYLAINITILKTNDIDIIYNGITRHLERSTKPCSQPLFGDADKAVSCVAGTCVDAPWKTRIRNLQDTDAIVYTIIENVGAPNLPDDLNIIVGSDPSKSRYISNASLATLKLIQNVCDSERIKCQISTKTMNRAAE